MGGSLSTTPIKVGRLIYPIYSPFHPILNICLNEICLQKSVRNTITLPARLHTPNDTTNENGYIIQTTKMAQDKEKQASRKHALTRTTEQPSSSSMVVAVKTIQPTTALPSARGAAEPLHPTITLSRSLPKAARQCNFVALQSPRSCIIT